MIRKHRNIIITFLVANFLFANVGLGVNWIYCYCKGTTEFSLFDISSSCGKSTNDGSGSCCKKSDGEAGISKASCCSKFEKYRSAQKPCTKKGKKYFKADLKICLKDEGFHNYGKEQPESSAVQFSSPYTTTATLPVARSLASCIPRPPSYTGRKILLKTQKFRC